MSQTIENQSSHTTQSHRKEGAMGCQYVVVDTATREGREESLARIDLHIKTVHIHGHLFVRVLKEILAKAPNLEVIEVTPKASERLTNTHLSIIQERRVTLRFGYSPPIGVISAKAWTRQDTSRAPRYKTLQKFFQELQGEPLAKFQQLLLLEFEEAQMVQRYFCLRGEPFISQQELGKLHGYAFASAATLVSIKIGAVLYYLDQTIPVSAKSRQRANTIHSQVLLHELHLQELRRTKSQAL